MYGDAVIALFEQFKGIWDPDNGLNPGMIVHPLPVDGNLRVRPRPHIPVPWTPSSPSTPTAGTSPRPPPPVRRRRQVPLPPATAET